MNPRLCLCLLAIVVFLTEVEGWRRRRRRRCPRTNCSVSPWSSWSTCSKPCGTGGSQLRTRKVTKGATCGGSCSYPLKATRSCNTGCSGRGTALPGRCICKTGYSGLCCTGVDGGWSGWSSWRPCSKTCGVGKKDRVRTCTKPVPRTGGKPCQGASRVEQRCITRKCPVNGGLSKWSTWTTCTKTCGIGTQERSRSCTKPPPRYGGKPCLGTTREKRVCNTNPCPVDGGWSSWSGWKSCSKTCGTGNQDRVRTCTRPAPKNGGKPCPGAARDNRVCNTNACPVDGGWSTWSVWRRCSKTCGTGRQNRERRCTQPAPKYGGKPCRGPAREEQVCNTQSCPVDGNWSGWSSWRPCSKTCGSGKQFRSRSCTNPTPQNGGKTCRGEARDEQGCNTRPCPVHGGWSVWGAWSSCDKSCGGGFRQRTRSCVNPPPAFGGKGCGTANHESSTCNLDPCSVDGAWSNWGNWSECSVTCGTGARSRDRLCDNPLPAAGGKTCEGESQDSIPCTNSEVCLVGVGCYGNFPTLFPDFLGNFRDEIEWFAPSFADEMKKVVKKCGQLASKKRLRFFAVEDFGKCYGDLSQAYGFGSDSKSSRCNFGVGLPNYYYVYMLGA